MSQYSHEPEKEKPKPQLPQNLNILNQYCPFHENKKFTYVCLSEKCMERGLSLLCSRCYQEKHSGHGQFTIKFTDYLQQIQKQQSSLKKEIDSTLIYQTDNVLREKHSILREIHKNYEKSIFHICNWYNPYLDFDDITQNLQQVHKLNELQDLIREMNNFTTYNTKTKKIARIDSKFLFAKKNQNDLPVDFLRFGQKMLSSVKELQQDLNILLSNFQQDIDPENNNSNNNNNSTKIEQEDPQQQQQQQPQQQQQQQQQQQPQQQQAQQQQQQVQQQQQQQQQRKSDSDFSQSEERDRKRKESFSSVESGESQGQAPNKKYSSSKRKESSMGRSDSFDDQYNKGSRKNSYSTNKQKERKYRRKDSMSASSNIYDTDSESSSSGDDDDVFRNNNNEQGPYGFDWATSWVEDLPSGWQELLETKSRTPCIGVIVSRRVRDNQVQMEDLKKCVKDNFKVYNCFFKDVVEEKHNIIKLCLLINVKTSTTIKAAKVLKKIIKAFFKGSEICVKTWGSRKSTKPSSMGGGGGGGASSSDYNKGFYQQSSGGTGGGRYPDRQYSSNRGERQSSGGGPSRPMSGGGRYGGAKSMGERGGSSRRGYRSRSRDKYENNSSFTSSTANKYGTPSFSRYKSDQANTTYQRKRYPQK